MEPMAPEEVRLLLAQARLGHLGLARGGDAYVLPVFFAYDGRHVYFHAHPGMKDDYLAGTDEACLAVTRAESEDVWESVLVFGPVEELTFASDRLAAMDALLAVPEPPLLGTSAHGEPLRSAEGMRFFRLAPAHLTGRKSVRPRAGVDVAEAGA